MTTRLVAVALVLGCAGAASGQQSPGFPLYGGPPGSNPFAFGPTNPFNRANQPLSPYLNLLRGGNPGVNYFYGVRPGTTGGSGFGNGGAPMMAAGAPRAGFFPLQGMMSEDPLEVPLPMEDYKLSTPARPVVFNNTLGFFPGPMSGGRAAGARPMAQQQQQSGGARPGGVKR